MAPLNKSNYGGSAKRCKAQEAENPHREVRSVRRRASAVLNLIAIGSTVVRHKHDSDSAVVPESCQIQDLLKSRNN